MLYKSLQFHTNLKYHKLISWRNAWIGWNQQIVCLVPVVIAPFLSSTHTEISFNTTLKEFEIIKKPLISNHIWNKPKILLNDHDCRDSNDIVVLIQYDFQIEIKFWISKRFITSAKKSNKYVNNEHGVNNNVQYKETLINSMKIFSWNMKWWINKVSSAYFYFVSHSWKNQD